MRREAGRIHLDRATEKVGNVDGSPWIRNQIERQGLPLDDLGLDFYHLGENEAFIHATRALAAFDWLAAHELELDTQTRRLLGTLRLRLGQAPLAEPSFSWS